MRRLHILALEPYYGGSHQAFLDGWIAQSRHQWTVLSQPARKWKWRMRAGAIDLAGETEARYGLGARWDRVFCSDMLDLSTFLGVAPRPVRTLPSVVYFHENQLTYPQQADMERDYTYGMINVHSALAADAAWFNSDHHRGVFLEAAGELLGRVPDHDASSTMARIAPRCAVHAPGIPWLAAARSRPAGPLRILWAARWEHDKNPETFFEALDELVRREVDFKVDVLGEQFRQAPPVFAKARAALGDHVHRWGHVRRREYDVALSEADVFVSTARHEFFGLSAVEAAAAGAHPLLPRRLAYPEVFRAEQHPEFFYDGSAEELADRLETMAGTVTDERPGPACAIAAAYEWAKRARAMDEAMDKAMAASHGSL